MVFVSSSIGSLPGDLLTNILFSWPLANILLRPPITYIVSRLPLTYILSRLSPGNTLLSQCNGSRFLPEELVTNILLRLPAKSILTCKLVCKEWHTIISSSTFVNMHFNHNLNLTRLLFYCYDSTPSHISHCYYKYSYSPDEATLQRHELPDNLLVWGDIEYIRGPCNGIFCVYVTRNRFALWNPTTRRLRFTECCLSHKFNVVGFGMDPLTGDFKILLMDGEYRLSPSYAVYTSGSDSWKYLKQESLGDSNASIDKFLVSSEYHNGFYYWIKRTRDRDYYSVLVFDMHTEIFEETVTPDNIAVERISFHVLKDSLALVSFDPYYNWDSRFEIWLMEGKGLWKKFSSLVLPFQSLWSFGWGTNKILVYAYVASLERITAMLYDIDSHCTKQLDVQTECWSIDFWPIFYTESLFSLKDNGGIQDFDVRSAEALEYLGYEGPNTKFNCQKQMCHCLRFGVTEESEMPHTQGWM